LDRLDWHATLRLSRAFHTSTARLTTVKSKGPVYRPLPRTGHPSMCDRMRPIPKSYSAEVAGTPEDCFAVLCDFADYPRWSTPVQECRVVDRHPDGRARRVAFALDMTVKTLRYVLEYTFDPPHGAT